MTSTEKQEVATPVFLIFFALVAEYICFCTKKTVRVNLSACILTAFSLRKSRLIKPVRSSAIRVKKISELFIYTKKRNDRLSVYTKVQFLKKLEPEHIRYRSIGFVSFLLTPFTSLGGASVKRAQTSTPFSKKSLTIFTILASRFKRLSKSPINDKILLTGVFELSSEAKSSTNALAGTSECR